MDLERSSPITSGRPTVAQIDLDALAFNFRQLQKRVPKGVKILAVVKADAYGHGALPISRRLEKLGVEYLGVAIAEEGIALRKGGVKAPILVLAEHMAEISRRFFNSNSPPLFFIRRRSNLFPNLPKEERRRQKFTSKWIRVSIDWDLFRMN